MSTDPAPIDLNSALVSIPKALRSRLIKNYSTMKSSAFEDLHDSIGHQSGKLAEVLLRVLQHLLNGAYTPLSTGLANFKNECDNIERSPKTSGPEGLRLLMPRALFFLYTMRNKRDFGHSGGEVIANQIDAATVIRLADWCICELIRVCKNIPIEDAQLLCDAIAERKIPTLWNVLGKKRVLDTDLSYKDQVLVLLYSDIETGIPIEDLFEWTEHSNKTSFKSRILKPLHSERLIEWDKELEMAIISPTGIEKVEKQILSDNL